MRNRFAGKELPSSLPDYLAGELGVAIVDGELKHDDHILEEAVAAKYAVSRAPVREAIIKLERRGLVRVIPRRGAFVVGLSLDVVADLFNVRAALVGLAGRYFVRNADAGEIAQVAADLKALRVSAPKPDTDPLRFSMAASLIGSRIYQSCGADYLARMLAEQAHGSMWGMIWRNRPLDFQMPERRKRYARDFEKFAVLAAARSDEIAENLMRRLVFESRDEVLRSLRALRGDKTTASHDFHDRAKLTA